ncbi:MAG: RDD family protein [bacterium]|jgi:uncharacterized RDD family membrane protein YckC
MTELPQRADLRLAGFGRRVAAYLIDVLPITAATAVFFYSYLGFDETFRRYLDAPDDLNARIAFMSQRNNIRDLSLLIYILYCMVADASPLQGTVGKRLLGLRVSDARGNRITIPRSIGRGAVKVVSIIPVGLGCLWALWSKDRRTWHDMAAKTLVLRR